MPTATGVKSPSSAMAFVDGGSEDSRPTMPAWVLCALSVTLPLFDRPSWRRSPPGKDLDALSRCSRQHEQPLYHKIWQEEEFQDGGGRFPTMPLTPAQIGRHGVYDADGVDIEAFIAWTPTRHQAAEIMTLGGRTRRR